MDAHLFDLADKESHDFNQLVVNGLPVVEMDEVEKFIDRILRNASQEMKPDLVYTGMVRASPAEEYRELTHRAKSTNTIEHAHSDMYMVKLSFELRGEPLPDRYIYLPFCTRGGFMKIRGSDYIISPVMADKAISVGSNFVFLPMAWDRKNFYRLSHYFFANGKNQAQDVIWSKIHNNTKRSSPRTNNRNDVRCNTVLAHYLFAKYGLTRTFGEMVNAIVTVGTDSEITEKNYPPSEWVICSSTMLRPKTAPERPQGYGPAIRLAFKQKDWNPTVAALVAGFFYVVDHFPDRITPETVDDTDTWRILLGYVISGPNLGEGRLLLDINYHLNSLDSYIESQTQKRLQDIGVYVEDIYQLFVHLIERFDDYITQSATKLSSTYGKRLTVLPYVLSNLTWGIHHFMFGITSMMNRKTITREDVIKAMNKNLSPTLAFRMNKMHEEVNPISISGDNIYFKGTSHVVLQEYASGKSRKRTTTDDPTKILHVSIAEAGSYNTMSKAESTGRSKQNPYMLLDPITREIIENPDLKELLSRTQEMIQRDS